MILLELQILLNLNKLKLVDVNGNLIKGPFTIIEFDTPTSGVSSPILRDNPGFISPDTGKTAGGAPEFVIPNIKIPDNSTIKIIQ